MVEIQNAVLGYRNRRDNKIIIDGISLNIEKGKILSILGANGCGKTTLLRSVLGLLPPISGSILIDGNDISSLSREQIARVLSYVPQYHTPPFPYTVSDVVLMGRSSGLSRFSMPGAKDEDAVLKALEKLGIADLKDEIYTHLSGGERQLVLIARAFVQETDYIFMDEPASSLDLGNQMKLLETINSLAEAGKGVCFTTHNPDHALSLGADVLAITGVGSWTLGNSENVITEQLIMEMYGVEAQIEDISQKNDRKVRQVVATWKRN